MVVPCLMQKLCFLMVRFHQYSVVVVLPFFFVDIKANVREAEHLVFDVISLTALS